MAGRKPQPQTARRNNRIPKATEMPGSSTSVHQRPRVVIVGAGFGGLRAARALGRAPAEVLLVDRNNYHSFVPLLYQLAASELSPDAIAYPVRGVLRKLRNAGFCMAEVKSVDLERRLVMTDGPVIPYDFLILCTGSVSSFFGVPGAEKHALPLKTVANGIALRNRLLGCFERAVHEPDAERRRRALTFAIVGGGATGVEFAGALAELIRGPLAKDFRTLDSREVRMVLLEAAGSLLPGMPERLRTYAARRLRGMGVEVHLGAMVSRITTDAVYLDDGTVIPCETVIWTAGVSGDPALQSSGLATRRNGQVAVLPTLQVPGHAEVYVIGDSAHVEQDGHPLPMVAPVAIQEGVAAARNIRRQIAGKDPLPFRYRNLGTMIVIGRNAAVAQVGGWSFTGFPAWLLWLCVHIYYVIGFRNRLLVMMNWAWDYFLFERAVRLILPMQPARASEPAESAANR